MPLAQHKFGRFRSTPKGVLTKTAPNGPYEGILHRAFVVARDVTRTFPYPVSSKTLAFAASTVAFFRKIVSMSAFAQNLYAAEEDAAKLKVDANAKAHGENITMPSSDWMSLIDQFRAKYGAHMHESCLPAQSYYEAFEEKLADGQLGAETLAQVILVRRRRTPTCPKTRALSALGPSPRFHAYNPDSPTVHLIRPHFDGGTKGQVRHHVQHVATCTDETARTAPLRGPNTSDLVRSPLRTTINSEISDKSEKLEVSNSSSLSGLTAVNMNFKFGKRLSLLRAPEAYRFNPHCGPFTVTSTTGWSTGSRSLRLPTLHRPCLYSPRLLPRWQPCRRE